MTWIRFVINARSNMIHILDTNYNLSNIDLSVYQIVNLINWI